MVLYDKEIEDITKDLLEFIYNDDLTCGIRNLKVKEVKSLIIPETVFYNGKDYKVTKILHNAFMNSKIEEIKLPNTLESIGFNSFKNCLNLKSIRIPFSVTHLSVNAFNGCSNLIISIEAKEKPKTWDDNWNIEGKPVIWDCKNNQEVTSSKFVSAFDLMKDVDEEQAKAKIKTLVRELKIVINQGDFLEAQELMKEIIYQDMYNADVYYYAYLITHHFKSEEEMFEKNHLIDLEDTNIRLSIKFSNGEYQKHYLEYNKRVQEKINKNK